MRPTEEPIGLFVARSAKTLSRAFDGALAEQGGSLPTWLVLASLAGERMGSQRSIAAAVGIEGPTLTHHLGRMEADGLVTRQRDPLNRRTHQVELTESGRERFGALVDTVQDFDAQLRAGLTDDELATLRRLLQRLVDNVGAPTETDKTDTADEAKEAPR